MDKPAPIGKIEIIIPEQGDIEINIQGVIPGRKFQAAQLRLRREYANHMTSLSKMKQEKYKKQQAAKEDAVRQAHREAHKQEQENGARPKEETGTTGTAGGPGSTQSIKGWTAGGSKTEGSPKTD